MRACYVCNFETGSPVDLYQEMLPARANYQGAHSKALKTLSWFKSQKTTKVQIELVNRYSTEEYPETPKHLSFTFTPAEKVSLLS